MEFWETSVLEEVCRRKSFYDGEAVAVLAPSHGHAPLHRPKLPGALVRGSRSELPSLPRPERSLWPHCDFVRMAEVPLGIPGIGPWPRPSPRPSEPPEPEPDFEPEEIKLFDAEAALAALRRERGMQRTTSERGRPLGRDEMERFEDREDREDQGDRGRGGRDGREGGGEGGEELRELRDADARKAARRELTPATRSLAQAEAMILASLRPRQQLRRIDMVSQPPVVELELPSRVERPIRKKTTPRRKLSVRDLRAREKIGKLLVAHYEVRSIRREEVPQVKSRTLRVVLAGEENSPDALIEGMSLLQNAQNLIGVAEDGDKSRVTLQTLCLVDRKVRVRSDLADAVRTLEELTKEKEKLLIDITSSQALGLQGNGDAKLSDAVQQSWDMINNEASAWDRAQGEKKSEKAKMEKSDKSEKSEKGNVEKRTKVAEKAALDQARQARATAVWRFALAEAQKESDDLGEQSLQRAARIEYAIKAAEDPKHPEILKALRIAHDLRALRAMRYCQHLMTTIEPVLGSAGRVANMIDQVIQDAADLYGVPKDHKDMEEARRLVLQARMEEAQVKRKSKAP